MTCFQALHRVNFNPRSREGSDFRLARASVVKDISIHAPVKGATCADCPGRPDPCISIHAPVKGATADPQYYQVII